MPVGERRGIPHHLIDVLEPHQEFSAGDFYDLARPITDDILQAPPRSAARLPAASHCRAWQLALTAVLRGLARGAARRLWWAGQASTCAGMCTASPTRRALRTSLPRSPSRHWSGWEPCQLAGCI